MLHLILQLAHVVGYGIHAESIQTAVEHVSLDAYLVKRLTECAHGMVGVLASQQVYLLEGTAIGFHTVEHVHVDDCRSYALQLVLAWLELTGALPHVPIDETELDSFFAHDIFVS